MKDYSKKIFTIPNIMSMFRIALIIPIVFCIIKEYYAWAAVLIIVSGVSDVIDGIIARTFNMVSEVGKILDPVADKLTQLAIMVSLCFNFPLLIIPMSILVIKEVASGIVGLKMMKITHQPLLSLWHGKAATVCLYIMLASLIVWPNMHIAIIITMVSIVSTLLLISFVLYLVRYKLIFDEIKLNMAKNNVVDEQ